MGPENPDQKSDEILPGDPQNPTLVLGGTSVPLPDDRQPLLSSGPKVERDARSPVRGSTGPRSDGGKQRSSQNAIKYGVFSKATLLKGESHSRYESILNGLWDTLQPEGKLEELLVEKLASITWRYRRLLVADGAAFRESSQSADFVTLGVSDPGALDRLVRYESSLERAFDRTLAQLERAQRVRKGQPLPPQVDVRIP